MRRSSSARRPRILLIAPAKEIIIPDSALRFSKRLFHIYRNTLTCLAGLTPSSWEVRIVDGSVEEIPIESGWDVVGITVSTCMAERAYDIAKRYKELGSIVVLGGIHATALPDEAAEHSDIVVCGEAEYIWEHLLNDIEGGNFSSRYPNASLSPLPVKPQDFALSKRHFNDGKSVLVGHSIQTSRGCQNKCSFCSVNIAAGSGIRARRTEDVIQEIRVSNARRIFFLDDNIYQNPYYSELLSSLKDVGVQWYAQLPINACSSNSLIRSLKESGCRGIMIGFDSLSNIWGFKNANPTDLIGTVNKVQDHGILVEGSFVFGFDNDKMNTFDDTLEFCVKSQLDAAAFHILTPYPGTPLFTKLRSQGRLFQIPQRERANPKLAYPWSFYDTAHAVFQPKHMSANALEDGLVKCVKSFYGPKSAIRRWKRFVTSPLSLTISGVLGIAFRLPTNYYSRRDKFRSLRIEESQLEFVKNSISQEI